MNTQTQIIDEDEALEMYNEALDECHGEMFTYPASYILEEMDPIGYRCGFNDFVSSLASDEIYVRGLTDDEAPEEEDEEDEEDED